MLFDEILRRTEHYLSGLWLRLSGEGALLPLDQILAAVAIVALFTALRRPIRSALLASLRQLMHGTAPALREDILTALCKPLELVPVVFGSYLAFEIIKTDESGLAARLSPHVIGTLVIISVYWVIYVVIEPLVVYLQLSNSQQPNNRLTDSVADWLRRALKIAVIFFAFTAMMQQWGIQIGPLLTGMGIFGVGFALGAKDLFTNLISGFLILLERRFQYGDWIKVQGVVEGTVERIGFRSTRIRQFDDAIVGVPNAKLSDNSLINYTAMRQRRIYLIVGVTYSTSVDELRQIRDGIEDYIYTCEDFVPHTAASTFVRINSLGTSSIDIMIYCFTKTTKWGKWLEAKERLAYRIMEVVEGAGSSIAFPSTSLYVEALPAGRPEPFVAPKAAAAPADPTPETSVSR